MTTAERDEILRALCDALPPARVVVEEGVLARLARDALHPARLPEAARTVRPLCVVCPQSTAEVAAVVRVANATRTPLIPMGGGSGLMGGAATVTPGIVLDLRGLQAIRIRPADRMAEVGAGVTIKALNEAAAPYRLMCGHDPWTVAVATVGGTIATNSLGYLGGKYGAMGDQVLGMEVVLPTGEVLVTRAVEKASTGPGLHRLFVGAEGCLGIITHATLRLFPLPQARRLQGWEFPDFDTGFAAIQALFDAGLQPALLDYGDDDPSPAGDPPAALMLGFEGPQRVTEAEAAEAAALCRQHRGRLLPQRRVETFWEHRHLIGDAYAEARASGKPWHERRPLLDFLHVALPPSAVPAYRRQCLQRLFERRLHVHQTGLWVYAGLFSVVYSGADVATLAAVHGELLELCHQAQGAMEYCHGVGLRLAPFMAREHGVGLEVLRRLKRSLDPLGILNPGKLGLNGTA
ncbi:MAG: oxidoreductase [Candidatus Tectimicrobiota bacterium]|nr:MAG: oxidoreductase [Candidatus Tectomicrobia bacterium]